MGFIIAILILEFIVFFHEFGHFIFAKIFKVPVREFSIGMGKRIFSFIWKNTRYSLKLFPIGGSCAMVGEDVAGSGDFSDVGGKIDNEKGVVDFDGVIISLTDIKKNSFFVISPIKKVIICLAGPVFNFLLAIICAILVLMISGTSIPVINSVVENSAAYNAKPVSLQKGDIVKEMVVSNNSEKIVFDKDVIIFLSVYENDIKNDPYIGVKFERDGKIYDTILSLDLKANLDKPVLGISIGEKLIPQNIPDFIYYAINEGLFYIKLTYKSIKFLFNGKVGVENMSGPVGAVSMMGSAINSSRQSIIQILLTILSLTNLISANLGVMNLLPIPALDGGRIIEASIEMLLGKPIDEKIVSYINAITMILLLLLMLYVFGLDIFRLFTGTLLN